VTSVNQLPPLPKGWLYARIQDISETTSGGTPSRKNKDFFSGDIPWLKSGELADNLNINSAEEAITPQALDNSSAKIIPKGSLLIALYGATVGKMGLLTIDAAINQAICAIQPYQGVYPKYLFWYLSSCRKNFLNARKGGAQPNISQEIVKTALVPLAPTAEQLRVIAKVEELFSFLDAGVDLLLKVKTQLKRYRQAVLKYAFEGKLTEEWRKTHMDQIEPATKLERIIRKEESPLLEATGLLQLPDGWKWTTIQNVAKKEKGSIRMGPFGSQLKKAELADEGVRVLWIENIVNNRFEYKIGKFITAEKYKELEGFTVAPGELLVTMMGTIGRVAIVPNDIGRAIISSHLLRIRLDDHLCEPEYLKYAILSEDSKKQMDRKSRGVVMKGLNTKIIESVYFPLPSLPEQRQLVKEIEYHLSLVDDTERTLIQNLEQSGRLRESVLKTAFEGKLVPQGPSDEPTEKLLERIREERAKSKGEKGIHKKKNNSRQLELPNYVK